MSTSVSQREHAPDPAAALRDALASGDAARARKAVAAWAERVRAAKGEGDDDPSCLADSVLPLASHADAKVRQSVADAADVLPEGVFDRLLADFAADEDHYVRAAVVRAAKRRAVRRKA